MWPFTPRERRQVFEGGGGYGGGDGGGGDGHEAGHDAGVQGSIDSGGFQGGDVSGAGVDTGGFDVGHEVQHDVGVADTIAAGPTVTDTAQPEVYGPPAPTPEPPAPEPTAPAPPETYGPPSPVETYGPPAPDQGPTDQGPTDQGPYTGGEPADPGVPAGVEPAVSGPQTGLDTPTVGFDPGETLAAAAAAPFSGVTMTGLIDQTYAPSFSSIVEQFGPNITGTPFSTDPFGPPASLSDDEQRDALTSFDVPITGPARTTATDVPGLTDMTGLPPGTQIAQALPGGIAVPPGVLDFPTPALTITPDIIMGTSRPTNPDALQFQGNVSPPVGSRSTGRPTGPSPDDTPMTGSDLGPVGVGTPAAATAAPTPDAPAPATPDVTGPAPGYTAAEAAASQPSTSPYPTLGDEFNWGTAAARAAWQAFSSAFGGVLGSYINQNLPGVIGGLHIPFTSDILGAISQARGVGGMLGLDTGNQGGIAGPPGERGQPSVFGLIRAILNGRNPRLDTTLVPSVGVARRPTIEEFLRGSDSRMPVGVIPTREETEDMIRKNSVLQDMSILDPNQSGDNLINNLLTGIGLTPPPPTSPPPPPGTTSPPPPPPAGTSPPPPPPGAPTTVPSWVDYFSGEASDLTPYILGQRTAFDPRRFMDAIRGGARMRR